MSQSYNKKSEQASSPPAKSEPKARSFKVMHTQVGPWPFGRVISDQEIIERGGVNHLAELLAIKVGDTPALIETNESLTETPLPLGPLNETTPPVSSVPATGTSEVPSGKPAGTGTSEIDSGNIPPK